MLDFSIALTPATRKVLQFTNTQEISPIVINAALKGRGRPAKEKRAGRPRLKNISNPLLSGPLGHFNKKRKAGELSEEPVKKSGRPPKQKPINSEAIVKKRRGRPPKNLIDGEESGEDVGSTKKTARERAEIALQPHEETYYDSGDICCLCQFRLNDPLQRNKPKMKCPQCHAIVHKPSFVKDRSEMGLVGCLNCNP